ncbi:MAG: tyrosine-type recombinase/integrase, partial [Candidatus Cybelea sp.]
DEVAPALPPRSRGRIAPGISGVETSQVRSPAPIRADGSAWKPDSFSMAFAHLVRRSKLPKVRLHDLRHSHATLALSAGTDLKTISAALGHSTISVTANIYVHAIEAMQRTHADRIEAVLGDAVASAIGEKAATSVPRAASCDEKSP